MKNFPMRRLFLLLALANLLFFAWQRWQRESADPAAQIAALQVQPERIRALSAQSLPALQKAAAVACAQWGVFSGPEIARAETALAALGLPAPVLQRRVTEVDGYWVHMPVLQTRPEVERKLAQLKALGVSDFQVVQEPANWRNAISLGMFKSEALANAELERLRKQGVRSALITRREHFFRAVHFILREPDLALIARISEIQRDFPGTELKAAACPVDPGEIINNK